MVSWRADEATPERALRLMSVENLSTGIEASASGESLNNTVVTRQFIRLPVTDPKEGRDEGQKKLKTKQNKQKATKTNQ